MTLCIHDRVDCLLRPPALARLMFELGKMEGETVLQIRCSMAMPDHLHLLVELGGGLSLSQAVGRLKSKTRSAVADGGGQWQENYFDHRVDPDEGLLPLFCYIFRNPYRAGLAAVGEHWPGWYCAAEDWDWFREFLNEDLPPPQWLEEQ